MLLYNCPLNERPSSLGFCSVDANRDCRIAVARIDEAVQEDVLVSVESKALEGALLGSAMTGSGKQLTSMRFAYGKESLGAAQGWCSWEVRFVMEMVWRLLICSF